MEAAGPIAGAVISGTAIVLTITICCVIHGCKMKNHDQVVVHPTGYSASYRNTYHHGYIGYRNGPYVTTSTMNFGTSAPPAQPPPYSPPSPPPAYSPTPIFSQPPPMFLEGKRHGAHNT
ncbi:transmembrane glycoprotein NMB-like isoform X2 [Saccostrea cucullata]|uniref:transmembrane glycoprotein NMB-like isoform X2 n=1 Tax=Saccostrea cuccullata TaxID=36930 RepID=UPI002ED10B87